ncbi:MAG: L-serine ammonia-lyase, iron-sulfur-dependent, subunit alpha [Sporolactobacillus sp.]|uniref:L-cysteine desulfidase family protein n=1 Tax=Sporolactobacillus sp. STSJ-5 TaxID=2965076 RepID=UPI002103A7A0|nr:L-serine ammonia-lyase, iron-sulfur-dependent, subunit alpha [Sporolactobacillus sp. STSJ-5]MCQ2010979.1 L-serine ammonia-lyase, iron-sulfur-dependent, subunit alpha [Sporolactobacillus sp. STSJ-5]
MKPNDKIYCDYLKILKEELIPATGCTEPIAVAYAAAKARELLGTLPESCTITVSGNIIKNVKSVVVPNTNGLRGISAAVAAGVIAGNASRKLEVLADIKETDKTRMLEYMETHPITVVPADNDIVFYIAATLKNGTDEATVVIEQYHTNIVHMTRSGKTLYDSGSGSKEKTRLTDRSCLNVQDIVDFSDSVRIEDISEVIGQQIDYNAAISVDGLKNNWGANIGKVLLSAYGNDVRTRARAAAAAGSDARMGGCEKPVVIVSGSGNQGMTASLPVIEYAKELHVSRDKLYRAVVLSDLVTIYQKTGIGRLSAFCGAVSAGCGAGAGIAYLYGGDYDVIAHTIVNTLAITSGIVCDGAKPSCAAKISAAVDAGILGYNMYKNDQQFLSGDGIVTKGVDNTIHNVGVLAKKGMRQTDREIIKIMLGQTQECTNASVD